MTKFNFTRGSKTPKDSKPVSIRIITPDHEAFKIHQLALELQRADHIHDTTSRLDYIDKAIKLIEQAKQNERKETAIPYLHQ